ncbi:SDR family oxidoreductase [Pontibacter harenae]|uniref:SDR family oxidoreductase n=1 Tax=Pontibacter harenae TaxID=2894083 RepID=UPI001E3A96D8|nr:SDR family oxidoreductase [Pontibacter harenae]MCC9165986.1 SDR family oxidoreductase [Pontibacter harenae]
MEGTVLVTGAMGTVGHEVIKQLAVRDGKVRAGVHSIIRGENLKRLPNVEVAEIDFKNPDSLHAAFTHIEKVFLLTPFTPDQVEMAKVLVDEAKRAGVKHIVRLSVMGADAEPGIQLGRWHREAEEYIKQSGIAYTFLRPTSFMQNIVHYHANSIREEGKFYSSLGDAKVSYIDVRDIASVAVEALKGDGHEGKTYDLTSDEALTYKEIAMILSQVTGKEIEYVDLPEDTVRQAMLSQGAPEWQTNCIQELNEMYKAGYGGVTTDTVKQITGSEPHTFREFAQDYQESFK